MTNIDLVLYILAFVLWILAALRVASPRVDLWTLGWALLLLTLII